MTEQRLIFLDIKTAEKLVDKYDPNAPLEFPAFAVQDRAKSRIPVSMMLTKTQAKAIDGAQKKLKALEKQSKKMKFSADQSKRNISAKARLALELSQISDTGMKTFIRMQAKELQPQINKKLEKAGEKPITKEQMEEMIKNAVVQTEEAGRDALEEEGISESEIESFAGQFLSEDDQTSHELLGIRSTSTGPADSPEEDEPIVDKVERVNQLFADLRKENKDLEEVKNLIEEIADDTDDEEVQEAIDEVTERLEEQAAVLDEVKQLAEALRKDPSNLDIQAEIMEKGSEILDFPRQDYETDEEFQDRLQRSIEFGEELLDIGQDILDVGEGIVGGGRIPLRLRMSQAQVKRNHGRGIFADIGKALTGVAANVVNGFVPGLGTVGKTLLDKGIDELEKALKKKKKGGAISIRDQRARKRLNDLKKKRQMRRMKGRGLASSIGALSGMHGSISKRQKMFTRRGGELTRVSGAPRFRSRRIAVGGAMKKKKIVRRVPKKSATRRLPRRNL